MRKEEEDRAERARLEEIARLKAEEERVERARQTEIARLKEEERFRAEEAANQGLGHFSSSEEEENQEHFDDVAGSNTSSDESEDTEEEGEEGGGVTAAMPKGKPEQPRVNKHIRFDSPTPSATESSDAGGRDTKVIETEVHTSNLTQPNQPEVASASGYHSQRDATPQGRPSQKEPSPSALALDEIRASLAVLRAESSKNASRLDTLTKLTAQNAEALREVIASMQRGEASTSYDAQAIIPMNVPMDYVTQSAMNALGDRLLQKVANFTSDFNNKATKAAAAITFALAKFEYRSEFEMRRVGDAVEDLLKVFEEKIKSMPQAEESRPKRRMDSSPYQSGPQNREEGEKYPTAIPSVTPTASPSAPTSSAPRQAAQDSSRQRAQSQPAPEQAEVLRKGKMPMASQVEAAGPQKNTELIDLLNIYSSSDSNLALSASMEYAMDAGAPIRGEEEEVVAVNVVDPSLLRIPLAVPLEGITIAAPLP
ncbi:uncharacterized protein LOC112529012 [Cynara cardunculus var. scolymus]|uniref:uncharacterized protein LOC112529012 n=1 Tax=Cynara cardunculus var. scolymus TaxID=59895 RepID=UPI000D62561F|nr:uncharacterized protein LOC112529012 [Cynara cardunculus var. scolymus]